MTYAVTSGGKESSHFLCTEHAEDLILGFLDQHKSQAQLWQIFHFRFSVHHSTGPCLSDGRILAATLDRVKKNSQSLGEKIIEMGKTFNGLHGFQFRDQDIILFVPARADEDKLAADRLFKILSDFVDNNISERFPLMGAQGRLEKIIDHKLLSARRIAALESTLDNQRLLSLPLRRKRRDAPLVLLVEDDRFTAAYTSKLLGSNFDIIQVRTGEDAILQYMDQAPDVVLMDIHLPGLSGQQTAEVIRRMDPDAFVIMISVDTATDKVIAATKNGVGAFLKKPFSKERLHAAINRSPHMRTSRNINSNTLNSSWTV